MANRLVIYRPPDLPSIVEKKGEGQYATVFLLDENTVLKTYKGESQPSIDFLMESAILRRTADHPNIVSLSSVYLTTETGDFATTMPFYRNTLLDWLKGKRLENEVMSTVYQIFSAISYLHSLDIMHGDIKPENILMDGDIPKICDFGLSALYTSMKTKTTTDFCGIYYRPPEVIVPYERSPSFAIDVWSCGVMLWELVEKRIPFPGEKPNEQIDIIVSILGAPTKTKGKWLTKHLSKKQLKYTQSPKIKENLGLYYDTIMSMLHYDSEKRPSMQEVMASSIFDKVSKEVHVEKMQEEPVSEEATDSPFVTEALKFFTERDISKRAQRMALRLIKAYERDPLSDMDMERLLLHIFTLSEYMTNSNPKDYLEPDIVNYDFCKSSLEAANVYERILKNIDQFI